MKALQAWEITKGDPHRVVACIDDGLAYTHIDIKDNAWKNPNSGDSDQFGYNFYDNLPSPEPIYFKPPFDQMTGNDIHGTACAGVICAGGYPMVAYTVLPPDAKFLVSRYLVQMIWPPLLE